MAVVALGLASDTSAVTSELALLVMVAGARGVATATARMARAAVAALGQQAAAVASLVVAAL